MHDLHLSTLQSTLLIIVTVAISLFFVLAATAATVAVLLLKKVKKVIQRAELAIDSVGSASENLREIAKQAGGPLALFKIIRSITRTVNKRR